MLTKKVILIMVFQTLVAYFIQFVLPFLIIWLTVFSLTSCGGSGKTEDTQKEARGCPSGNLISTDRINQVHAADGLINIDMNRCISTGTYTCLGDGTFLMNIESKSKQAIDLTACQGLGEFHCEYKAYGYNVTIYCSQGPLDENGEPDETVVNRFNPAMTFLLNNGY